MSTRPKVSGIPTLERDVTSQAIINRNQTDYQRRLAQKRNSAEKDKEIQDLKAEVSQLKELVQQIISQQQKQ
jgi:hypothetical protein